MNILLAIILGVMFGFALQKNGVTNTKNIEGMLSLKDFRVMKIILTAIGLSSFLAFVGLSVGLIDVGHVSVKAMNLGVIVGGAIFGLGWGVANYCPGTAVTALGEGKKDAVYFVLGGLLGAFAFMLMYNWFNDLNMFSSMFGGKTTLIETGNEKYDSLIEINPIVGSFIISAVFLAIAYFLPEKKEK